MGGIGGIESVGGKADEQLEVHTFPLAMVNEVGVVMGAEVVGRVNWK
jgi:hypothetical protein